MGDWQLKQWADLSTADKWTFVFWAVLFRYWITEWLGGITADIHEQTAAVFKCECVGICDTCLFIWLLAHTLPVNTMKHNTVMLPFKYLISQWEEWVCSFTVVYLSSLSAVCFTKCISTNEIGQPDRVLLKYKSIHPCINTQNFPV